MRARRAFAVALLVTLASTLGGCPPLASGSRFYRPAQPADATVLSSARRNVFPDDVRAGRAGAGPVAWAGVIERVDEADVGGTNVWDLYVAHHFRCRGVKSDGPQTDMTADANRPRFIPTAAAGDMAMVVGEPIRVGDAGVVHLRCLYLDVRPKAYYSTDRWDYGFRLLRKF